MTWCVRLKRSAQVDLSARLIVSSRGGIGQFGAQLSTRWARHCRPWFRTSARRLEEVDSGAQALSGLSGGASAEGMEQQSGEITSMAGAVGENERHLAELADNMGNTERLAQENAQATPYRAYTRWKKRRRPWNISPPR